MSNKVITNKTQYQRLLDLLEENPDIAQGFTKATKEEVNVFWYKVKEELNSLGPPVKDASSWRKVWLDWKAYVKRKLVENKKEIKATGGGMNKMHSFSNLEESVIKLTGLETSTSGIKGSRSFGMNSSLEDPNQEPNEDIGESSNADVSMSSDVADSGSVRQRRRLPPNLQQNQSNDTANLLREQMELQKEFYRKTEMFWEKQDKNAEDISSSLRRINRGVEKICELKKKSLEESQRHNKIKEELLQRKIELKLKMIQIEESKYIYPYNG